MVFKDKATIIKGVKMAGNFEKRESFAKRDKRNKFEFESHTSQGRPVRNEDPYLPGVGMKEPALCRSCHAIYRNKRWYLKEREFADLQEGGEAHWVVCPACQKAQDHYPEGIVTLKGDYLWQHQEEILNILRNTESTAMAKNPLERIIQIKPEGEALIVETTEEKLAEHLGRALYKAHHGELNITWSDNNAFCRVTWER